MNLFLSLQVKSLFELFLYIYLGYVSDLKIWLSIWNIWMFPDWSISKVSIKVETFNREEFAFFINRKSVVQIIEGIFSETDIYIQSLYTLIIISFISFQRWILVLTVIVSPQNFTVHIILAPVETDVNGLVA